MSETSSSSSRQPRWKRYAVGGALLAAGVAGGSALGNTMIANADTATGTAAPTTTSTAPSAVAVNPTDGSTAAPADSTAAAGTDAAEATEAAEGTEAADGTGGGESNDGSQPERSDETALTGADADKVTAAALAKYPGATVDRVEKDSEGVYEAHLKTTDGQDLEVQVGADFTVTGVQTHEQQ